MASHLECISPQGVVPKLTMIRYILCGYTQSCKDILCEGNNTMENDKREKIVQHLPRPVESEVRIH